VRAFYSDAILRNVHKLFHRDDSVGAWSDVLRRLAEGGGPE
jgi:hypothetical protein